ncbi:hypothetical protein GCM10009827_016170 [Dactylosporangium maewongense]|uniref:Ceramidase n=1 Tax=Dactylosporangium maewongense TaxID=634393 RepID=A0ABN1ZTT8_9ACTN
MYVDSYCERTAPGLWNEPLNAASNAAFLVAALLLFLVLRRAGAAPRGVRVLPGLIALVGVCSWIFHMAATAPTAALDSLSILVFILVTVTVLVHRRWGVRWALAWLAAPAFVLFAAAVTWALSAGAGTTLGGYPPALLALIGFGVAAHGAAGRALLAAAGVFAASLTLRTVDGPLCGAIPTGTHFLWHCLNAVVLFLAGYATLLSVPGTGRKAVAAG